MKKFGKNKIYLDNLIGFDPNYKKESKISKLRNRFNNFVRGKGNNFPLCNNLGDILTTEIAKKGREEILFLSFFVPAVFLNFFGYFYDMENRVQKEIHKPKILYTNSIQNLMREKGNALILQQKYTRNDDVKLINDELKKRNFDVEIMIPENATKENLIEKIKDMAGKSDEKSKTVFYFATHGSIIEKNNIDKTIQGICLNKDSKCINEDDDFELITPSELYEKISKVKGEKALILDSCFSGAFTEYLKPNPDIEQIYKAYKRPVKNLENYITIAACPKLTVSTISDKYIDGKIISALMNGLYSLLSSEKGEINISKDIIVCGNEEDRTNINDTNKNRLLSGREYLLSYEMQRVFDTDFILPERFDEVNDSFLYKSL